MTDPVWRPLTIGRPFAVNPTRFASFAERIWQSGHYTNFGPLEREFQAALSQYLHAGEVELFANGHLALEAMLRAIGADGGEIITTPYTFASTTQAILNTGFTPVFADIEADGVNIDPAQVERLVTPRTRAILAVHVFGVACQHDRLQEIADRHDLALLYDAAHAFGAQVQGRSVPTLGDASMISLHATKIFHSIEGGALVLNSDRLDRRLVQGARNFGYVADGVIDSAGSNGKMSELHAAVGLCNLEVFGPELAARIAVQAAMHAALQGSAWFTLMPEAASSNASYFPIFLRGEAEKLRIARPRIVARMKADGILTRPYFWPAMVDVPRFRQFAPLQGCPRAKALALGSLCLPIQSDFTAAEIARLQHCLETSCRAELG